MNHKNCASCHQPNPSDMRFCQNCGTEFMMPPSDLPPTVFGGINANLPGGQTPPNFQPPNYQQPDFQPPNYQQPNYQQFNYQQPNFQSPPNFQPPYQSAPATGGGQAKKILLGIGGILIGFIMVASGGVKLYRAFGGSSPEPAPYYSPTPRNLYSNTNNGSRTASPSPPSNNQQSEVARTIATGRYEGTGKNVTLNRAGTYKLRIDQATDTGRVEGQFTASDGSERSVFVKGTMDSSGKLLLEGADREYSVAINGTVTKYRIPMGSGWIYGFTVSAGYAFVDAKLKTQSGNFVISRQ